MARPGGAQALRRATGGAVEPLPWRGLRGWGEGRSPLGRGLGDRK